MQESHDEPAEPVFTTGLSTPERSRMTTPQTSIKQLTPSNSSPLDSRWVNVTLQARICYHGLGENRASTKQLTPCHSSPLESRWVSVTLPACLR